VLLRLFRDQLVDGFTGVFRTGVLFSVIYGNDLDRARSCVISQCINLSLKGVDSHSVIESGRATGLKGNRPSSVESASKPTLLLLGNSMLEPIDFASDPNNLVFDCRFCGGQSSEVSFEGFDER